MNHADGSLKLVAEVKGCELGRWVHLSSRGGLYRNGSCAQRYYPDGLMEDFARDDDTSPAYPATMSYSKWVRICVGLVLQRKI